MTKTTFIYALLEPGSDDVRYVGKADNVDKRLKEHVYYCGVDKTHKGCWILSLQKQGKKPKLVVLEEVSADQWQEAEKRWIAYYREVGARLTNIHPGGGGCAIEGRKRRKSSGNKVVHKKAGRPFLSVDIDPTVKIEVTLPADLRDKLDRITNNRSAWVRQTIEAAKENTMNTQAQAQIKRDIEAGKEDAVTMGLDCPIVTAQPGGIDIMTRFSRDERRRNNGGEYDYWTEYRIRDGRLFAKEAASCDFWQPEQEWRDLGPMTYNELSAIVR